MMDFLLYEGKVAVALLVFYLFYRFLLKKETFHRFNRVVLVGTAVLSFLLPLCIITIRRPQEAETLAVGQALPEFPVEGAVAVVEKSAPWWPVALTALFWAGAAFVLVRVVVSILSIARIVRRGELVREEDGCKVIVTERDIDPFSWMRYIVLSRKDWENNRTPILAHEKAHIRYGHSVELLLVDVLSAFQWFNPAIWMLRADLQELHEYEADDAVLRSGANLKEYQYLLIRKVVSKSGYSVANSFNHNTLKRRITMMSKPRSPLRRRLLVLYLLPFVCLGIGLQARTVYEQAEDNSDRISLKDYEKIYIDRRRNELMAGKNQVILVGISHLRYTGEDAHRYREVLQQNEQEFASMDNIHIDDNGESILITMYFPLANARVSCNNTELISDENGMLTLPAHLGLRRIRIIGSGNNGLTPIPAARVDKVRRAVFFRFPDLFPNGSPM